MAQDASPGESLAGGQNTFSDSALKSHLGDQKGEKGVSWETGPEYTWGRLSADSGLEPFSFGRSSSWEKEKIALEVMSHSFSPLSRCGSRDSRVL